MSPKPIDELLYGTTQNLTLTTDEKEMLAGYLRDTVSEWIIRIREKHEPFIDRLKILTEALSTSGHRFSYFFSATANLIGEDTCNDICFKRCLEMLFYHAEAENLLASLTRR